MSLQQRVLDSRWTYRLIAFACFASLWEFFATLAGTFFIPSFVETGLATVGAVVDPETWEALALSNQSLVIGFVIAIVLGIPMGLAMGRFRSVEQFTDVYLTLLITTPMAVLIPLLIVALGFSLTSRVVLVVLFSIPVVILNSRAGIRQIDIALIEMARTHCATERQIWARILLPGALPAIMTGIRIGLGRAVTGMVIVELLMVSVGVGRLILRYRGFFENDRLYAIVALVVLESLILISIARFIERRLTPWAASAPRRAVNRVSGGV